MTSSNGHIFSVTGHLCGKLTGDQWIPRTKASDAELWCFLRSAPWINSWVNYREAGGLRRHRDHYDVSMMCICISVYAYARTRYKPPPYLAITKRYHVSILMLVVIRLDNDFVAYIWVEFQSELRNLKHKMWNLNNHVKLRLYTVVGMGYQYTRRPPIDSSIVTIAYLQHRTIYYFLQCDPFQYIFVKCILAPVVVLPWGTALNK